MHAPEFALPVQYIRQITEQVRRMNVPLPASFIRNRWDALPGAEVQVLTIAAFEQAVQDAIDATGEPAFGLLVGERMLINSHGMLGYAAMNCATLDDAIALIERYFLTRTRLVTVRRHMLGPEVCFVFDESLPLRTVRRTVLEAIVLTVKNLYDYITAGAAPITHVCFPFEAPPHADLAAELFGCQVRHGQPWCGFVFPASALSAPLAMADPTTLQQAIQACQRDVPRMSAEPGWAAKLRRVLLEKQGAFPSLNVAARLFNLTPRTLHRRLIEEGTSYRGVRDEVRHMLALEHLKSGKLSIPEIAYVLGYTDTSNFRRAFIRWQAMSPAAYQSALGASAG
jgi:AraC-like DNA-binding protein